MRTERNAILRREPTPTIDLNKVVQDLLDRVSRLEKKIDKLELPVNKQSKRSHCQ